MNELRQIELTEQMPFSFKIISYVQYSTVSIEAKLSTVYYYMALLCLSACIYLSKYVSIYLSKYVRMHVTTSRKTEEETKIRY